MSEEIELRTVLGALRRRIGLILVWAALCTSGAGVLLLLLQPIYTSTALVIVDPGGKDILEPAALLSGSQSDSARVDSEVELAGSDVILLRVIDELGLASDDEFGVRLGWLEHVREFLGWGTTDLPTAAAMQGKVLESLRRAITVRRRDQTFLIAISARSQRPDFAAGLANKIADTYVAGQVQSKISAIHKSREIIESRLQQAALDVEHAETAFDQYVDEQLGEIDREVDRPDLVALRDRIEELTTQSHAASAAIDMVHHALQTRDWASVTTDLRDAAIRELQRTYASLQGDRRSDFDPIDEDTSGQLQLIENRLAAQGRVFIERIQQQFADKRDEANDLRRQLRAELLESELPAEVLTTLYRLRQSAELSRQQYQTLLAREAELEMQTFLQLADSRLASPAIAATRPSFPDTQLFLLGGLMLGLVVGSGAALVTENFVGGFTDAQQVAAILGFPVAASVPLDRFRTSRTRSAADHMLDRPLSEYAEGVRRVRVAVDRLLRMETRNNEAKVILVTSAEAAEGKSTLALALTRAIALNGKSALLVDCDLRRPSLHHYIGSAATAGLLDYLAGDPPVPFEAILTRDEDSGAQVIIGLDASELPTDQYVTSRTFQRLIGAARRNFDYVILDTSPIGHVVDGIELSAIADLVLVVVKWGATPQAVVKSATAELSASLADIPMRVILNQSRPTRRARRLDYANYY